MRSGRQKVAVALLLFSLAIAVFTQLALAGKKDKLGSTSQMEEQKRAVHVLNRLTFGPRPGDVGRVMQMGIDKWIDEQLHPDRMNDSALDARLSPYRTL